MLSIPASSAATAAEPVQHQPAAAPAFYGPAFTADAGAVSERAEHAASRGIARPTIRPAAAKPALRKARPVAAHRSVRRVVTRKARKVRHVERTTIRTVHRVAHRTHAARLARRASGHGSAVVAYAKSKLGQMYSFGGLDCSGLTKGAYARVGVSLPHKASAQDEYGRRESRSAARPGDLVFWGGDNAYHVAVYIGGGRVIHAPGRGRRVQVASVWGSPTFVRVS